MFPYEWIGDTLVVGVAILIWHLLDWGYHQWLLRSVVRGADLNIN